jgi:hypothetical protein
MHLLRIVRTKIIVNLSLTIRVSLSTFSKTFVKTKKSTASNNIEIP